MLQAPMNEELLAPPKMTVRSAAWLIGGIEFFVVLVGFGLALKGTLGWLGFLERVVVIGIVGAAYIWGYAHLMRRAKSTRPERMPLIHAVVGPAGMLAFVISGSIMAHGTPLAQSLDGAMFMVPFMLGMMLVVGGVGRRVGDSTHCPACEYEFRFDDPADAPIRCPECGTPWLGRLKKGRRVKSIRLIAIGAAISVGAVTVLQPMFYLGSLAPHLPTWFLYASLYASPRNVYPAWDELARRPLDAESTRVMAERVLRLRPTLRYDTSPSRWFEAAAAAGTIPGELVERFYAEGFAAELRAPARAKVGEEITVSLRVVLAVNGSGTDLALWFAGYGVGDSAAGIGRQSKSLWAHEIHPEMFSAYRDILAQRIRMDRAGDVRIRATYWVNYQPSFREGLEWRADGTPAPGAASVWLKRYDIERVVHVE